MKIKVLICYICCMALVLCTACSNQKLSDEVVSQDEEIVYEEVIIEEDNSTQDDATVNSSYIDSNESTNTVSDNQGATESENSVGYTTFNYMQYRCEKDIPGYDSVYVVDFLRANNGYNNFYGFELSCETKDVRIEGKKFMYQVI